MNEYVSLEDLRRYKGLGEIDATDDDELLRDLAESASRVWDALTGLWFYPKAETRYYDHPRNARELKVNGPLLEITTFTTQSTGVSLVSGDYFLLCGDRYDLTPYDRIRMKMDGDYPNLLFSGTVQQANAILGIWGWHEDWSNAWVDSGDTVQDSGSVAAAATTLTVSNIDGRDEFGRTPRIKEQNLLKIDSEYLYVWAKNQSDNTLRVKRGVNGTTAAAHTNGTTVYVYKPMNQVYHATRRLTAYLHAQKDAKFEAVAVPHMGYMEIPSGLPKDLRDLIHYFRDIAVAGIG